jgi:hypothetical protein
LCAVTALACGSAGCGDDDDTGAACVAGTATGCTGGLVCEAVVGGEPACFARVELRGRVLDLSTEAGIGAATVVALDVNGGARSTVAITAADGTYALPIAVERDASGDPVRESVTLRVAASGYQVFPTAPRTALPIDLASAGPVEGGVRVVMDASTDVGLLAFAGGARGIVRGEVDFAQPGGVLVIATQGGTAVSSAVTDTSGDFALFNVPAGETLVSGYRVGVRVDAVTVTATSGEVGGVVLVGHGDGLGTVSGSVNVVNPGMGSTTSVILVVESTFVASAARGEAPAGLRAAPVSGAFSIAEVPPGRYVVLAAFENDFLVRDPDTSIGGTTIQTVEVPASGGPVSLDESFKITGALTVVSPGADGIEVVASATPEFVWADDSSEDGYEVRVFDAFGTMVHENTAVPRVTGSSDVTYTWTAATLEAGMIYQFRALSYRESGGTRTYISATEDLLGVFQYAP